MRTVETVVYGYQRRNARILREDDLDSQFYDDEEEEEEPDDEERKTARGQKENNESRAAQEAADDGTAKTLEEGTGTIDEIGANE